MKKTMQMLVMGLALFNSMSAVTIKVEDCQEGFKYTLYVCNSGLHWKRISSIVFDMSTTDLEFIIGVGQDQVLVNKDHAQWQTGKVRDLVTDDKAIIYVRKYTPTNLVVEVPVVPSQSQEQQDQGQQEASTQNAVTTASVTVELQNSDEQNEQVNSQEQQTQQENDTKNSENTTPEQGPKNDNSKIDEKARVKQKVGLGTQLMKSIEYYFCGGFELRREEVKTGQEKITISTGDQVAKPGMVTRLVQPIRNHPYMSSGIVVLAASTALVAKEIYNTTFSELGSALKNDVVSAIAVLKK